MNDYPIVRFVARNGKALSWAIAILFLLATVALAHANQSGVVLAIGLGAAVILLGVLLTAAELVGVIADTLLPR